MAKGDPIYPVPRCMRTGNYELIFYIDESNSALKELVDVCSAGSRIDVALNKASAKNFFHRVSRGLLAYEADPAELQEVVTQSPLLELYPLTPESLARGYSADPQDIEAIVICLLHTKNISGSKLEVRDRQNEKMRDAKKRFIRGEPARWALNVK